ncbi:hypothetical protein T484DRAFT_1756060 [Baffinella frigidus]|nr:hypothetical protein T484DRAFT_1756060 [Cryptophyta sp. CCMP2293]
MDDATNESVLTTQQPIRITRRFNVSINGSMNDFEAMGRTAATWQPVDNCHTELFGVDADGVGLHGNDHATTTNAIGNAVIVKATMLQSKSTFTVPLGLTCNIVPSREITDTGEKFLCTVLPDTHSTFPETVFEADVTARQGMEWRNLYPQYNTNNLETQGIMEVKGCPYVFVSQGHPAINLLRANSDMLGSDIDQMTKIDGEWFKVSRQVVMQCCQTLRTQVLNKVQNSDLNTIQLQLHRFQNVPWTSLPSTAMMNSNQSDLSAEKHKNEYVDTLMKPCMYMGYLKLPITERIQWVCVNVAELPTMNANGGNNGFGTLMSMYNLVPLSLRPTTTGRVATFAEQLEITKTGIFMN